MKNKDVQLRVIATTLMWLTYLGFVLIGLNMLQVWGILLAFVMMIPVVLLGMFIWSPRGFENNEKSDAIGFNSTDNAIEKRKRDRLSQALSQLSDSQLTSLRDGIRNGTLDDERLRYMIDDEGELVERYD